MGSTTPTRIDDELYASAKAAGAIMSRSTAQQIAHWARVGREVEAADSISARDIAAVLAGRAAYDDLTPHEQAVVRAGWEELVEARRSALDLAAEYADRPYAELDDDGRVVVRNA